MLSDILQYGLDMQVVKDLLRAKAEFNRRLIVFKGNDNTMRLWRHLTERFGTADGFKYMPTAFPAPWVDGELARLVKMDLLEYDGEGRYFWKPVELSEDSNEATVS